MKVLFIDGKRTGYSIEQCGETMTVRQLVGTLKFAVANGYLDADSPIYLANDNGYTFGEISDWNSFMVGEADDAEDVYESAKEDGLYELSYCWESYDDFEQNDEDDEG